VIVDELPSLPVDDAALTAELKRLRLHGGTLYDVIRVVSSSADLDRMLDGIVEILSEATSCHACFIYLRDGRRLRLRAATRVYAHLVGQIEFGIDEGLAGWVARTKSPEFIRENALDDPRMKYVPEMHEERFQSMVAVPVPARSGEVIGVVVLHTEAPREFDRWVLDFLSQTASLVAGAIENAQLLQEARRRVESLTTLSRLTQEIAAVDGREQLYATVARGVRSLLGCAMCQLYLLDEEGEALELAASVPVEGPLPWGPPEAQTLLGSVLRGGQAGRVPGPELTLDGLAVLAAPVAAGDDALGVLAVAGPRPFRDEDDEMLRAVANQVAVALNRAHLIERLTAENAVRDLFAALVAGDLDVAEARARAIGRDLRSPHLLIHVALCSQPGDARPWPEVARRVEALVRRLAPGAMCDLGRRQLRAMLSLQAMRSGHDAVAAIIAALDEIGRAEHAVVGVGVAGAGVAEAGTALQEAEDAARIGLALLPDGGALAHRDLGAYRYLVRLAGSDVPRDRCVDGVERLADYDDRRRTQLLPTLEQYLCDRRSRARTAQALFIHPNTLRQRLERIEQISGFDLACDDLLSLELAIKVVRLRRAATGAEASP
jgi:GAF domain-containing protein